jgi:glycosyltransferase involved in cell wall biosynthesis
VEALAAADHTVTVLAGRPSYDPTERYGWRPWRRDVVNGVTVERVGSTAFSRRRMFGRVANYISYLTLAFVRGLSIRGDIILAMTDPPIISVVAAAISRLKGIPLIYHIQDLHPDMAVAAGLVPRGAAADIWEEIHRWALRTARLVIVLGEDMRRRVLAKGVDSDRVVVVRTGPDMPESLPARDHPVIDEIRCGFPFVALHAGNLGFAGTWNTILEAAELLEAEGAGIVFVGSGAAADAVRERAQTLSNVRLLPYRPLEEVQHVLQAGDVHLVTARRGLEGLVVPSKLYPVLGAGRPVLAVATMESDLARIVTETGCGWVADPDDSEAVAAALRDAMSDRDELEARGRRARTASKQFDRPGLLAQFVTEVEAVLEGSTHN